MKDRSTANILWFDELHRDDVNLVGGKASSLGELTSETNIPVPYGFATTSHAYRYFMEESGANAKVNELLESIKDYEDSSELHVVCGEIRRVITESPFPADLTAAVKDGYAELEKRIGQKNPFVAIRSSATAEDLPDASFAGQQESYLNISGADDVVSYVKECFASLFTERATYYRHKQQFPHEKVALAATVQMMVSSKASGVMFSVNITNGDDSQIVIDSILGLGEYIVQGIVTPDDFLVDKATHQITQRNINEQTVELLRAENGGVAEKKVPAEVGKQPSLTDDQVLELAGYAKDIEKHYGCYMDMEFALDQYSNKLWLVQARPETFWSQQNKNKETTGEQKTMTNISDAEILVQGLAASPGLASGPVHIIESPKDIAQFNEGEVLVTSMTSPDWVPAMKKAAAIITDNGGMTCHAAIVSREMQIPSIVGTKSRGKAAMESLQDGQIVTVDAKHGVVYAGQIDSLVGDKKEESAQPVAAAEYFAPTATQVMMNLGNPELAEKYAPLPADGIGLMREEFIWTSFIHEHPLNLIANGESDKAIKLLAEGISQVARAMAPRPVVLRFSDFKSSEYRNLKGGDQFEPHEPSDLLGWRGASRYYDPKYVEAFKLELAAVKKVREEFGLTNLNVMVPFVRTVAEMKKVTELMEAQGLSRSADFKVYMMAEIPSNIILADQFNQYIDGYSIGSNDLTMLLLGCDRNNDAVASLFDERNLAVKRAIVHLIKTAHRDNKTVSICGQAPSEYPEFTEFLIQQGIDYVSVNPDMVKATKHNVAHFEQRIMLDSATNKGRQDSTNYEW